MCGIAGYVGDSSEETLRVLIKGVEHRGPDDSGIFTNGLVGLAHARLSIIDTSPLAHQPMFSRGKSVAVVFNGEIYNFRELREELRRQGVIFSSRSDTEVLLHLYARDGERFLERCDGMFALALYDFPRKRLILARDRMGEKPLYWTLRDGTLYFASELRSLMLAGVTNKAIDSFSLAQYLAFDAVPTPRTILQGVQKLPPATYLVYEDGAARISSFWEPPNGVVAVSHLDAIAELDRRLFASVRKEIVSDVPLGVFLSGGLDSATIAYYVTQVSTQPVDTFSIGFDEASFDESSYARAVAQCLGTRHHEHRCTVDEALALVSEIPEVFSEPVADASVLPTMLLSRFARTNVTVALGGDGGDELFAGYPTFQADAIFSRIQSMPGFVRMGLKTFASLLPASQEHFSFGYNLQKMLSTDNLNAAQRHAIWLGNYANSLADIAGPALEVPSMFELFGHVQKYAKQVPGDNGLLWMYARTYLMDQVLVKVDRASMRYSLETRAPFLDRSVVEYSYALPYDLKYRRGVTKYLLKELMRARLPDGIADRKKKGFGVPLARWLAGPLRPLAEDLLNPDALSHDLFNVETVAQLLREHFDGHFNRRKELWNLMVFQMWYRRWIG